MCGKMTDTQTPFSGYDPFAWIYNKHWGESFLPTILPVLENLVLRRLRRGARILDLCCGTGQLARQLTAMGYRVTGVDGSAAMLEYARQNAPGVEFIQADARSFTLPQKYHAVVSAFDSLNHVMTLRDLKAVFERAYAVLRPGGYFLCDLNTEPGYIHEWHGDFTIVEEDHVCVVQNTYSPARRTATFDATIFRLEEGYWRRTDVLLYQKCHDPGRVKAALKAVGFADIEVFGFDHEAGVQPLNKEMRRAFFFGRRLK